MDVTKGRIVYYTFPDLTVRPAVVVQVWTDNVVNLAVFTDGPNDMERASGAPVKWVGSARPVEHAGTAGNTWSWPPRV